MSEVQVLPSGSMLDQYDRLWQTGSFADVQFVVGDAGAVVRAHRAILSQNPVFAAMFESGFEEGTQSDVSIPDSSPEAFGMLLRIIYSGRIDLTAPICVVCELLALADKYQVPEAAVMLAQHIAVACDEMTAAEAHRCLETAHMITGLLPGKQLVLGAWPVLRHSPAASLQHHAEFWVNVSSFLLPVYPPLAMGIIGTALVDLPLEHAPALLRDRLGAEWLEHMTYREAIRCLDGLKLLPVGALWAMATNERRSENLRDIVAGRDVAAMLHLAQDIPGCAWDPSLAALARATCTGPRLAFVDAGDNVAATNVQFSFVESARFLPHTPVGDMSITPPPPPGPFSCGLFRLNVDILQFSHDVEHTGDYLGLGMVAQDLRHSTIRCTDPRTDRKFLATYCKVRGPREAEGSGLVRNGDGKFATVSPDGLRAGDRLSVLLDLINGYVWLLRADTVITTFRLNLNDRYCVCAFGGFDSCVLELVPSP
eukprot:GGOE01006604.1.p1 GENE.GGOE01006604.1~~GGOE01006604.1.p1  ORF type:complete len:500 (-),score=143.58 GGOE01006604.1:441-1886(-)